MTSLPNTNVTEYGKSIDFRKHWRHEATLRTCVMQENTLTWKTAADDMML